MTDIVERLRVRRYSRTGDTELITLEAADEIERLRAVLEDIAYPNPLHNEDDLMGIARAALEGKR